MTTPQHMPLPDGFDPIGDGGAIHEQLASAQIPESKVILYTELPKACPKCQKKFSQSNFRRRFKRKIRPSTWMILVLAPIIYISFLVVISVSIAQEIGKFMARIGIFVLGALIAWAIARPKGVKMKCIHCGWKHTFVVHRRKPQAE